MKSTSMHRAVAWGALVALIAATAWAGPLDLASYSTDFDAGLPAQFTVSNFSVQAIDDQTPPDEDLLDYGFSAPNLLRTSAGGTQTATLTLTNLPRHAYVDLDFVLAALDSIDGTDGPFEVKVDGQTVWSQKITHAGGGYDPGPPITLVRGTQLGFAKTEAWHMDAAYDVSAVTDMNNIPHTADTLTVQISTVLNGSPADESFGVDNLRVRLKNSYDANFDGGLPAEITASNLTIQSIEDRTPPDEDYLDYGFQPGKWLRTSAGGTQTATLTLTDLPLHNKIDLNFLIGTLDSIDGSDGPFEVKVDGETIWSQKYGSGGSGYNPGAPVELVRSKQLGGHLGTDPWWFDGGFDMGKLASVFDDINHNKDTLTIEFTSGLSSGPTDESYAIDNVQVVLKPYYSADFENGLPAEWAVSRLSIQQIEERTAPDEDYTDYGFSPGSWLRTSSGGIQTATLTLTDLPCHEAIDLDFLIATMDSIDSSDGPFEVYVDGVLIFSQKYGSAGSGYNPGAPVALVRSKQLGGHLGTDSWWFDGGFDMGELEAIFDNIPHSSRELTIQFVSGLSSGPTDESYAIDDVGIFLHIVPEPASLGLLAAGLGVLLRRRRRSA